MSDAVTKEVIRIVEMFKSGDKDEAARLSAYMYNNNKGHPSLFPMVEAWFAHQPRNREAIYALGMTFLYIGYFIECMNMMRLLTSINPTDAEAYAIWAICERTMGGVQTAADLTIKALTLDPNNIHALTNAVDVFYDQGEFEKALQVAEETAKLFPDEAGPLSAIARISAGMNDDVKSGIYHRKAIAVQPENASFRVAYLVHLLKIGDTKETPKVLDDTYKLFQRRPAEQAMHNAQWQYVAFLHIMMRNKVIKEGDVILSAQDMEKIEAGPGTLEIVHNDKPVWVFKGNEGLRCNLIDWCYFDDKNIYLNSKLTDSEFDIMLACGMDHKVYARPKFAPLEVHGPGILFGCVKNYYHWLVDYLPRFAALDMYPELKDLPIYMSTQSEPFQDEALALLGIDPKRITRLPIKHIAHLKDMYIPFMPGRPTRPSGEPDWMKPNENPFMVTWLREKFWDPEKTKNPTKRYFMSRAHAPSRRCVNEEEIFAIAQKYGFEKMQNTGKNFSEQLDLYSKAEAIIGPHGAAFTNMIFASEKTKIMEFFPLRRVLNYYRTIAAQIGQPYKTIEGIIIRKVDNMNPDFGDYYIEPALFESELQSLLAS